MDISDGLGVDAAHIARRSGVRCVLELDRVPLADGVTLDDLAFGEDYELLAAVAEPGPHTVIGRVEVGAGLLVLLAGEPVELPGWQHFTEEGSS
jgi:thiamine monophosphate kinase